MLRAIACVCALAGATAAAALAAAPRPDVLAVVTDTSGVRLALLDPQTLRAVPGREAALPSFSGSWSLSPDGSHVAVGAASSELEIADVADPSRPRIVPLGSDATVGRVAWVAPHAVLVVLDGVEVAAVDPDSGRLLWRKRVLDAPYEAAAQAAGRLLLLVPPPARIGATRLLSIDAAGHVRSLRLAGIRTGKRADPSGGALASGSEAGLAVDPTSSQAFVVADGQPVAQVDLKTMTATSHMLSREPSAAPHGLVGSDVSALWLGDGRIAVTGVRGSVVTDAGGTRRLAQAPLGLSVIDTAEWTERALDTTSAAAAYGDGVLLGSSAIVNGTGAGFTVVGSGLTAYRPTGEQLYHRFGSAAVSPIAVLDGLVYAGVASRGTQVLRADSGVPVVAGSTRPGSLVVLAQAAG